MSETKSLFVTDIHFHQASNRLEVALNDGRVSFIEFDKPIAALRPATGKVTITFGDRSEQVLTDQALIASNF